MSVEFDFNLTYFIWHILSNSVYLIPKEVPFSDQFEFMFSLQ